MTPYTTQMVLTPEQLERHKRHILLKEIGGPGVRKLAQARVSIVGAGALGGPCALYLAAAGVGEIEIMDDDAIDRSNLQRQIQFRDDEIGVAKASVLATRLRGLNPDIEVLDAMRRFDRNVPLRGDLLIDASDNYETRFALNALAHESGRALVSGAASGWSGQVSVYASGLVEGAPCYRCFVPDIPPEAQACDEVGVVGAVTGMIGSAMALEAIKVITKAGDALIGKVLLVEGLGGQVRTVKLRPDTDCPVCSA